MEKQNGSSRRVKLMVGALIAGFALASLLYRIDRGTTPGCNLLGGSAWVVVQVLRPVLAAEWHALPSYLSENSGYLSLLPQIVSSLLPLLCVVEAQPGPERSVCNSEYDDFSL
jgi:hypothetical protein